MLKCVFYGYIGNEPSMGHPGCIPLIEFGRTSREGPRDGDLDWSKPFPQTYTAVYCGCPIPVLIKLAADAGREHTETCDWVNYYQVQHTLALKGERSAGDIAPCEHPASTEVTWLEDGPEGDNL